MKRKFRQRQYTIQEGHYTGPKDMDKVPGAVEVIGKSALAGTVVGGMVGKFLENSTVTSGAITGAKTGTIAGVALKIFLNYLHNPMTKIKYSDVDKNIRREFGVYRISGVTMGDSISKRASIDEKFSFNDRDVCKYKINFVVADNKITMYTFDMTDSQLTKTSNILDYYCKKYVGMEYNSGLINRKMNAYSVSITFTNYQVISNFIMELSNTLEVKINLLNNKAIVDTRLKTEPKETTPEIEEQEKEFSISSLAATKFRAGFNKISDTLKIGQYDLLRLLKDGGSFTISGIVKGGGVTKSAVIGAIYAVLSKLSREELDKIPGQVRNRGDLNNNFLRETLKRLHYIENINFSHGDLDSEVNMSLAGGVFLISVDKKSSQYNTLEKEYYKKFAREIKRIDTGNVVVYSYIINSIKEFEKILNTLMKLKINDLNLFDK